jgi:hypothetical protein
MLSDDRLEAAKSVGDGCYHACMQACGLVRCECGGEIIGRWQAACETQKRVQ